MSCYETAPTGSTSYKCDICDKSFEKNYQLTCHLLSHPAGKDNESTRSFHINLYSNRIDTHEKGGESRNDKSVKLVYELQPHSTADDVDSNLDPHGNVFSQQDAPLKRGISNDTFDTDCGKQNSYDEIVRARKEYQPDKMCQDSELSPHLRSTGQKLSKCKICGNCFQSSGNLTRHMHIHTAEIAYTCKICTQAFTKSSILTSHLLIHTGEKPFKCTECIKCFRQGNHLTAHMRIHTGEKPYKCDMCEKSFRQSSDLTKHKLIHTGVRKYKCNTCDQSLKLFNSLLVHIRTHTGENHIHVIPVIGLSLNPQI